MSDVYLDTAGRALQAAGIVCRRRDRGDRVVLTVKRRGAPARHGDGGRAPSTAATSGRSSCRPAAAPTRRRRDWPPSEAREQVLGRGRGVRCARSSRCARAA